MYQMWPVGHSLSMLKKSKKSCWWSLFTRKTIACSCCRNHTKPKLCKKTYLIWSGKNL